VATGPGRTIRRASIEEVRRNEFVVAALYVIARQGFDRTTVRDIAQAAGASVGSVHYYFKTKDELLYAAFEESEVRSRAALDELVAASSSPRERLDRLVDLCFPLDDAEDPQWGIEIDVWQQAARHASFRELFARGNRDWVERIARMLADGVEQGAFAIDDVAAEARSIAALIDGLGIYARVTQHVAVTEARALLHRRFDALSR
jgi:AcrR family transcriptional regulator